jgi:hypothetical protein
MATDTDPISSSVRSWLFLFLSFERKTQIELWICFYAVWFIKVMMFFHHSMKPQVLVCTFSWNFITFSVMMLVCIYCQHVILQGAVERRSCVVCLLFLTFVLWIIMFMNYYYRYLKFYTTITILLTRILSIINHQ